MTKFQELCYELRGISVFDRLKSKIFRYPAFSSKAHCEIYDKWLNDFLNAGVKVVFIDRYKMILENSYGTQITFCVANYPLAYGHRYDVGSSHAHCGITPNWSLILRLRELQLSRAQEVIDYYVNKSLSAS